MKTNFQEKDSKKKSKEKQPSTEDVILLLISIFTENDIKNEVNGANSLLLNLEGKKFELTVNEIESING